MDHSPHRYLVQFGFYIVLDTIDIVRADMSSGYADIRLSVEKTGGHSQGREVCVGEGVIGEPAIELAAPHNGLNL
jgi:hypothetical protein